MPVLHFVVNLSLSQVPPRATLHVSSQRVVSGVGKELIAILHMTSHTDTPTCAESKLWQMGGVSPLVANGIENDVWGKQEGGTSLDFGFVGN